MTSFSLTLGFAEKKKKNKLVSRYNKAKKKKSFVIIVVVLQSIHVFGMIFSDQAELSIVNIRNSSQGSRSERREKKRAF